MAKRWKVSKHNGLLKRADGGIEHRPELELWLRVVHSELTAGYEEFAVAAGDAARLAKLLNRAFPERTQE